MNRNIIFYILIFTIPLILLASSTFAEPPFVTGTKTQEGLDIRYPFMDTLQQYKNFTFNFHIFNASNSYPINNQGISCYFHLYNKSGAHLIDNISYTYDHDWDFEYFVTGWNFSYPGWYSYLMQCNNSALGGAVAVKFRVTVTGTAQENYSSFAVGMVLLFFVSLLFYCIYMGTKLQEEHLFLKFFHMLFAILNFCLIIPHFAQIYIRDYAENSGLLEIMRTYSFAMGWVFWGMLAYIMFWLILKVYRGIRVKKDYLRYGELEDDEGRKGL